MARKVKGSAYGRPNLAPRNPVLQSSTKSSGMPLPSQAGVRMQGPRREVADGRGAPRVGVSPAASGLAQVGAHFRLGHHAAAGGPDQVALARRAEVSPMRSR